MAYTTRGGCVKILRDKIYQATKEYLRGQVEKHVANAEVRMSNSVGIGEHSDVVESLEKVLAKVAHYSDMLNALQTYLK